MAPRDDEEEGLRTVALHNAQSIHAARQRAEEAQRKQSEWLRITLASIGDAVISTDAEGRVTFLNGVAEALTGWTQAEAPGRSLAEVFHIVNEHTRQPAENPALRALREATVVGLANHTVLIAKDGAERLIDDSAAPMRDASGAAIGAVVVFRDVTERKRAEEDRARLAAIVESSEDAIISKTLDGIIRSWNAGAERLFGYPAHEAVGQSITLIIPPELQDEERAILARLRRGERIEHYETVRVAKDGHRMDISITVSPLRARDGLIVGASKVARDISFRKQAELQLAKLLEREREQARLLHQVADAALSIHSSGSLDSVLRVIAEEARTILRAQQAASSLMTGDDCSPAVHVVAKSEKPGRGSESEALAMLDDVYAEVRRINRPIRLNQTELESHPAWRKPGSMASPSLSPRGLLAAPFTGRSGQCIGFIQVEDKEDGEFTESDEAILVQLAHIASVAIENARLYGELRDQDRRKEEFLALLAHELRNPLAPLRNGLQVMRLAAGDPNALAQARDMMDRQLGHMVRLIDDLLDVSRISSNKMELRRSRVLLADVISSAVETSRPVIDAAEHELSVSLPTEPVLLDADLTRLAQVFSNLLTNSAKYTQRGGCIWLTATRTRAEVVISVRDTGIGIPAEALPTIFDMFSQVDRSIERSSGGLGIGLALVKGLVEMHGGTVEAASAGPGKGSALTVRLPVLAKSHETLAANLSDESQPAGLKRKILVVDDNRDSAESMAMMLQLLGNELRLAHDGLQALEIAESFRPHVILMDVGMPKLNGYETTQRIRAQPWGRDILVIALTGWGQAEDRERSREAGCNGHLVKPVHLPDLERLLAELAVNLG